MWVSRAEVLRIRKVERAKRLYGSLSRLRATHESVADGAFANLIQQGHRGVERRRRALRDIRDTHTACTASTAGIQGTQIGPLQYDASANNATAGTSERERRKADGGFAGPGLTNQPQYLAARELQVHAVHQNGAGPGLHSQSFDAQNQL
ncbi:MAG: hypothetical protein JWL65_3417 [Gammaproteobacteria bacterium]|nr:hypothetical protein [Gammaproteobacteria bacterium]